VSAIRDVELDAMGNAIGVLNSAGGVIERRTYDLWGAISSDSGALGDSAFVGWKGLLWEGDSTRLYYAQNRWYDPNTGRFVSEDPIGIAGGLNAYVFAGDDPVNGSDPSGLFGGCGGLAGPCFPGHGLGTPLGCLTRYPCVQESGKYLPGVYLGAFPGRPNYVAPDLYTKPKFILNFTDQHDDLHQFTLLDATFIKVRTYKRGPQGVDAVYNLVGWEEQFPTIPGEILDYANFIPIRSTLIPLANGNYSGGFSQIGEAGGIFVRSGP
jgi:RHS repeat-associated protein